MGAPAAMIVCPVVVSPVKQMRLTPGWADNAAPAASPNPCTTLNTPSGRPASCMTDASRVALNGDHSAGLSTTVLPAARAGAIRQEESISGAFHGMIMPATPTGLRIV